MKRGLSIEGVGLFTLSYEFLGGRFLSIFPRFRLQSSHWSPEIKVLPVKVPVAPMPVGIVTLKNLTLSPIAKLFFEGAGEVAKARSRSR
jgi:hypothetical protein